MTFMQGQQKTPTGSRTQQAAHRRNTMTKYFPVLHDPGHSNESFPCRERLVPMQPLRMQACYKWPQMLPKDALHVASLFWSCSCVYCYPCGKDVKVHFSMESSHDIGPC